MECVREATLERNAGLKEDNLRLQGRLDTMEGRLREIEADGGSANRAAELEGGDDC